jgi:hypothetical protein
MLHVAESPKLRRLNVHHVEPGEIILYADKSKGKNRFLEDIEGVAIRMRLGYDVAMCYVASFIGSSRDVSGRARKMFPGKELTANRLLHGFKEHLREMAYFIWKEHDCGSLDAYLEAQESYANLIKDRFSSGYKKTG